MTRERPDGWGIESKRFYCPNLVSCEIVTGHTWTLLVGDYLTPLMLEHLAEVKEAINQFNGQDPVVLGYLNMDLEEAWSSRSQRVVELLMEYGLINLVGNFRECQQFRYLKTWTQVR